MRDLMVLSPAGMFSVRKFLLFVATLVVTVFAYLFVNAPTAHAASAEWKDGGIVYGGNTYTKYGNGLPKATADIPKDAQLYTYASNADKSATPQKINIIWFDGGTDPKKAKTAHYAYYDQVGDAEFSNPTKKASVAFATTAEEAGASAEETTSCVVDGIGWIVCPVSTFLSKAMDELFSILKAFLTVAPMQTDPDNPLYRGWSIMRNFANVAFIIAFMIIIYSQITNIGLSSYGIKRLLPRVIIAAILVNVSYWICAIGIDLSNIAGASTYDILENIRNDLVGANDTATNITWTDVSGAVLSGGAAAAAGSVGIYAAAASAGGAIYLLLPILVGILLAALVAILILAARQAVITILVIIAPLAFVAYLLPNTEKYFNKWKDIFVTMLTLFPLFAGVIGGAQLAGEAIIQNAMTMADSSPNKLNLIIFGMAIKVAPVVITPFLLKLSGSLLGKIAGVVNNPGKGLVDRTRNWSQGKADEHKAKALANTKNPNFMARTAQGIDARKRKKEGWKKANETRADANWANSEAYRKIHGYDANTSQIKEIGENAANQHVAQMRATDAAMQGLDIRARASKLDLDVSQAKVDANWEAVKAQGSDVSLVANTASAPTNVLEAVNRSQDQARDLALGGMRKQAAERLQKQYLSNQLQDNTAIVDGQTLQEFAGGIDTDGQHGAQRALASALKDKHAIRSEAVANAASIIDDSNLSDINMKDLALSRTIPGKVTLMTDEIQEAALKKIGSSKNTDALQQFLDEVDTSKLTENQRISLVDALQSNGSKPKYVTAGVASNIRLKPEQTLGKANVDTYIRQALDNNKYPAETLVDQDKDIIVRITQAIKNNRSSYSQTTLDRLQANIDGVYDSDILRNKVGDRDDYLKRLKKLLNDPSYDPDSDPNP